jgi:hypothetical protein
MRISVAMLVLVFSLVSVACGPVLQPPVQGEWSNFHDDKDKVSKDAKPEEPKPAEAH